MGILKQSDGTQVEKEGGSENSWAERDNGLRYTGYEGGDDGHVGDPEGGKGDSEAVFMAGLADLMTTEKAAGRAGSKSRMVSAHGAHGGY